MSCIDRFEEQVNYRKEIDWDYHWAEEDLEDWEEDLEEVEI